MELPFCTCWFFESSGGDHFNLFNLFPFWQPLTFSIMEELGFADDLAVVPFTPIHFQEKFDGLNQSWSNYSLEAR